jgi:hypothetical protein
MIGLPKLFEHIIIEQTALTNSDTTASQRIKFGIRSHFVFHWTTLKKKNFFIRPENSSSHRT